MSSDEPLYKPIFNTDGHLASSKDGGYLGAVLNNETNKLQGQARWIRVEPTDALHKDSFIDSSPDSSPNPAVLAVAAGIAIGVVSTVLVVKAAPHVKKWWVQVAQPKMQTLWKSVTQKKKRVQEIPATLEIAAPIELEEVSTEIAVVLEDNRELMSNKEAQQRYLAMMLAIAFAAEQMRILGNVRIADPEKLQELQKAAHELTSEEAIGLVNRILEADSAILDEDSQAMFLEVFEGGVTTEDGYKPIEQKRVEEAMRFDDISDLKSTE